MNKPQSKILLIIALILFFLFTTIIFLAYQGRQVLRSRAQTTTATTPTPTKCPEPPTPYPIPTGCQPIEIANIDVVNCPGSATDVGGTSKILFRSFTCSDGYLKELTTCKDPASCLGECLDQCQSTVKKIEIHNECLARTASNCQLLPTKQPCADTCDFNSNGQCYDTNDVIYLRGAIAICQSSATPTQQVCTEVDAKTVDKNGVLEVKDMTDCSSFCSSCSASTTPVPSITSSITPIFTPAPTLVCREGLKDVEIDKDSCISPTATPGSTTGGNPPSTNIDPTSIPEIKQRILKYECWDDSVNELNTECLNQAQFDEKMIWLIEEACKGKKSPGCIVSLTPIISPTPLTSVVPTSPTTNPSILPTLFISPTGGICPKKSIGDCNCDSKLDLSDFECFRRQYLGKDMCSSADFNADGQCSLPDFEIYRKNLFLSSK